MTSSEQTSSELSLAEHEGAAPATWRLAETARIGWRTYLADNPPRVVVWATGIRGVLQALFFVLLGGRLFGGYDRTDAYLGALAILMTGPNVFGVANVPLGDKVNGTFWRLRRSVVSPVLLLLVRAAPYPAIATIVIIAQAAATALLLARPGDWLTFLPYLPLFALMSVTAGIMGLAAAALSVSKRADVLAPNLISYLILLGSGAVVPPGRVPWLDAIGTVLPARHALAAIRASLHGGAWWPGVVGEVLVGLGWLVAGGIGLAVQDRRARRTGYDEFE